MEGDLIVEFYVEPRFVLNSRFQQLSRSIISLFIPLWCLPQLGVVKVFYRRISSRIGQPAVVVFEGIKQKTRRSLESMRCTLDRAYRFISEHIDSRAAGLCSRFNYKLWGAQRRDLWLKSLG